MSKIIRMLKLDPEAELFDAKPYIIKTFFAIVTAYLLAKDNPYVQRDMISVLFGLMLTLEPVTLTGIKSGWQQVYATLIGAIATALIIALFGVNVFTVGFGLSFTLYVSLKINWKAVSPFAIFTSVYMTQYIQLNGAGEPSILLTFQLRMLALGLGVGVAILFNFIFSMISYRKLMAKRVAFITKHIWNHLNNIVINANDKELLIAERSQLPQTFNDLDWLSVLIEDLKFDHKILKIFKIDRLAFIEREQQVLQVLRTINHLTYDMLVTVQHDNLSTEHKNKIAELLDELIKVQDYYLGQKGMLKDIEPLEEKSRINEDINRIIHQLGHINSIIA